MDMDDPLRTKGATHYVPKELATPTGAMTVDTANQPAALCSFLQEEQSTIGLDYRLRPYSHPLKQSLAS
jgi:hypothetical protein